MKTNRAKWQSRAFTLVELLIVIGIIAVLAAVTLVASRAVGEGSKIRATQDLIRNLEGALLAYTSETGQIPLPYFEDPRGASDPAFAGKLIPVADGRNMDAPAEDASLRPAGPQVINSGGLAMAQLLNSNAAKAQLDVIPAKFIREFDATPGLDAAKKPVPVLRTVFDAWGRPIRYVHPSFSGVITKSTAGSLEGRSLYSTTDASESVLGAPPISKRPGVAGDWAIKILRRSDSYDPSLSPSSGASLDAPPSANQIADSDGGACANNTPYFYSAGPDGKVGVFVPTDPARETTKDFNKDNVYTTRPANIGKRTKAS